MDFPTTKAKQNLSGITHRIFLVSHLVPIMTSSLMSHIPSQYLFIIIIIIIYSFLDTLCNMYVMLDCRDASVLINNDQEEA